MKQTNAFGAPALQVPEKPVLAVIAFGSNLWLDEEQPPQVTLKQAIAKLHAQTCVQPLALSHFYESAPVPASDQPWYVNGALLVQTMLSARALLALLLEIEQSFGRVRSQRNAARTLDLDLISYDQQVLDEQDLLLPHPRMKQRAFVLLPLFDIAPHWQHPVTGESITQLIALLPEKDRDSRFIRRLEP